jgi:hypothetical protein
MPNSIVLAAVFVLVVSVRDFAFRSTSFDSASFINSPTTKALPNRDVCHSCRSASNRVVHIEGVSLDLHRTLPKRESAVIIPKCCF